MVCVVVMIGVSYLTEQPDDRQLQGLTFATVSGEQRAASRASWGTAEIVASVVVVGLILVAYLYFRG